MSWRPWNTADTQSSTFVLEAQAEHRESKLGTSGVQLTTERVSFQTRFTVYRQYPLVVLRGQDQKRAGELAPYAHELKTDRFNWERSRDLRARQNRRGEL